MSPSVTGSVGRGNPADAPAADELALLLANRRQIAHIWSVEDVRDVRPDLDDEQAWSVLQLIDDQKDATQGITWETLAVAAAVLYPEGDAS